MNQCARRQGRMGDDPPFLTVGTEVSAKYKGAFCEAKVRKVVRSVKCKVTFKLGLGTISITDDQIRGGTLRVGSVCEVKHPEKKEFVEAIINKIQDCSQYTVVFDDGDITTLRRTALCLKSGRHFAESETLDQLPLTHPEHFSNPVIGGRKGRRSRQAQEESSDEEDPPKKGKKKEEKEADIGKVVCVELGDKKKQKDNWFPGLVVAPTAQDAVRIRVKDEYLVRSFKDGRYFTVPKKEATEFTREIGNKVDNHTLKAAVEKALQYLDQDELPPHWDRDLLFGLDESSGNSDSDGALDSDSSDDEPREEKDHFVAQLYKFMDDRGTPINRGPTIGSKDVDLYKLFKVVHKRGGYNRVTNHNQWKTISQKLGFGQSNSSVTNMVKQSYKKFLHSFEDFYRKLGCTMVNHPRGHRSRHRTGRSLIRDRDRATPTNIAKEKEKKEEKAVPTEKTSSETAEKESLEKKEEEKKDEKKEEGKPKEPAKKSKTRDDKTDTQSKQKGKDALDSTQTEVEEKDNRSRSKKDLKTSETKVPKFFENLEKEEIDPASEEMPEKESERSEETKTRESKSKGRESKPKERAKICDKSKNKDDNVKASEEEKNEDTKKKVEKKPAIEEEEKNTRATKMKDDSKTKKEIPRENSRETRTPVRDSSNRTPVRLRKEEESAATSIAATAAATVAANLKKRGRKRKETDEKVKAEESMGHLASHVAVCVGDKLKVYYGPTHESKVTYEAKVLDIEEDGSECMYLVHYTGWNTRYDEWIKRGRIADNLSWTPSRAKRQRQQQSQHKTSRPSQGKRGRPSVSSRGHDGLPNPPRSTTPSSVTSSSSRTKSPATRSTPRTGRSAGDGASPGNEFRRRTRRMSGHTDVSVATDSESEEYESEAEPENEMAQTRSRTTEQRRSVPSGASATSATMPRQTPDKREQSPVSSIPTLKEEPVRRAAPTRKKASGAGKKKDSPATAAPPHPPPPPLPPPPPPPQSSLLLPSGTATSTSAFASCAAHMSACTEDNADEKAAVEVAITEQQQQTAEKRRSRRGKRSPAASSRSPPQRSKLASDVKMDIKLEINAGTESEEDRTQPKGRDFDLNQIRSELKGIEKAVKSPLELAPVQSHGDADDEDDDEENNEMGINIKVEVKEEENVKMEVQELKTNVKAASTVPALFADIEDDEEEEEETFKVKSKELTKDSLATITMSPMATTASTLMVEEEDVYEFKEPEPFEFEVRKRESPDAKGLSRRPGSAVTRILELSSAPDVLPAITNLSSLTTSLPLTRSPDTKSPRKRFIRTSPKDSMTSEGGKKIRRTPQKKLSSEISKNIVETKEEVSVSNSSPPQIQLPVSDRTTLSPFISSSSPSCKTSMEHIYEKVSPVDITPSTSSSLTLRGKQTLVRTLIVTSPVTSPSIDESPVSPPLLSLPDDDEVISARKSPELGPLRSMLSESHDDDYDDDHEDRLVISESDDMVTEHAEPLFSYQQGDHEDLFPTLVTSAAVVTAVGTGASKAEDPPCLSPATAPSGIFHSFSSPVRELAESPLGVNVGSSTNSMISRCHSPLHQQQQKHTQLPQLQVQSESHEQLRHLQLDQQSQPWQHTQSLLAQEQLTKPQQEQFQLPKLQKEQPRLSKQPQDQYQQPQQVQESTQLSKSQQLQQEQLSLLKRLPERLLSPKPQQEQCQVSKQLQEKPPFLKQLQEHPPLLKQQQELPHVLKQQETSILPKQQQEVPTIPRQQEEISMFPKEMLTLSKQQELLISKKQTEQYPLPKQLQEQSPVAQQQPAQSLLPKFQKQLEQSPLLPKLQKQLGLTKQMQEQSLLSKHVQDQVLVPKQLQEQLTLPKHQEHLFLKQPHEQSSIPKQPEEKSSLATLTQDVHLLAKQSQEISSLAKPTQMLPEKTLLATQLQEKPSLVKLPQENPSTMKLPQVKSSLSVQLQEKPLPMKHIQEKPLLGNMIQETPTMIKQPSEKSSLGKQPQEKFSMAKQFQEKQSFVKQTQELLLLSKPTQEKVTFTKQSQEQPSLIKHSQELSCGNIPVGKQSPELLVTKRLQEPLLIKQSQESIIHKQQKEISLLSKQQQESQLVNQPVQSQLLKQQEEPSQSRQIQEMLPKQQQEQLHFSKTQQEPTQLAKQILEQTQQLKKKPEPTQLFKQQHLTPRQSLLPQTHHQLLQPKPLEMEHSPPAIQHSFGLSPTRSRSSTAGSPAEIQHGEDSIKELLKQQDDEDEDDSINAAIRRALDRSIMEEDEETSGDMELFCEKQALEQTESDISKAASIPAFSSQKGSPASNASPRHSSGSNTPARKRVTRVTMTSAFLDSEESIADSSDDEGQRLIIDPMDDEGSSQPRSCSSPMSSSEMRLRISEADTEHQPQYREDDAAEAPVDDELRTEDEETFEEASIVMSHNASPAPIPDDSSSASEVVAAAPIVTEEETMEAGDLPETTVSGENEDVEDSLDGECGSHLHLNSEDAAIEVTNDCETVPPVMTPVIVKVDLDDTSKMAEAEIISGGVVLDASTSELSPAHPDEETLGGVCHTSATTVVTATIVASSPSNLNPQSPTSNIVCETNASSAASSILALAAVPLGEVEAAEIRQESRSDDADSQLLGSLLCQETIPGSPAQAGEGGGDEPLPESKVLVLEMPFASVPASSCDAAGPTMSLPVPMSVPLSIPVVTPTTTAPAAATTADITSEDIQAVAVATASVPTSVTDSLSITATAGPAQHHLAIPSPGVSKLNSSEAAPVLENTPPTTPDSTLSTMSGSPTEEHGDMSPAMDNESSKSHRDSFEMDLDSCPEGTKVGHFSEDDSLLNVEVSNSCDSRLQGLKLVPKKSGLDLDKDNEVSPKKRRRSHKRSESESNKRVRCSSGRSVRPAGGTGSDSDDTSENSALGCTPMASSESTLSSKSPRPSKYNFYVELDPELDGSQRIALLQQKLQELRKTYMNVKAELACIDRRRKKLRRREREVEKASKQEVACS